MAEEAEAHVAYLTTGAVVLEVELEVVGERHAEQIQEIEDLIEVTTLRHLRNHLQDLEPWCGI